MCILAFCFMTTCFCIFPPLYNHCKVFLKVRPHSVYLALERVRGSKHLIEKLQLTSSVSCKNCFNLKSSRSFSNLLRRFSRLIRCLKGNFTTIKMYYLHCTVYTLQSLQKMRRMSSVENGSYEKCWDKRTAEYKENTNK